MNSDSSNNDKKLCRFMMPKKLWARTFAESACASSKTCCKRRRVSTVRYMDVQLEVRVLLSSQNAIQTISGLPGQSDDEDLGEYETADIPVEVSGTFLTSQSRADSKPMFFNDVRQGQLDTCVFTSALASVALTDFNLADAISSVPSNHL